FDRPHHLDDDVDVRAGNQFVDVVGKQVDRHTPVCGHPPDADTAQHQRRADPGGEIVGTVLDDANNFTAHIAQSQYRYTDRLLVTVHVRHSSSSLRSASSSARFTPHLTSRLKRSSTVSLRRISRAFPSRTATTAGRPIRL